jgi:hypothetical protein
VAEIKIVVRTGGRRYLILPIGDKDDLSLAIRPRDSFAELPDRRRGRNHVGSSASRILILRDSGSSALAQSPIFALENPGSMPGTGRKD